MQTELEQFCVLFDLQNGTANVVAEHRLKGLKEGCKFELCCDILM